MLKGVGGYNFSYSGLKTAVINYVHHANQTGERVNEADVACSFQHAATDILVKKAIEAAKEYSLDTVTVGGGVVKRRSPRRFGLILFDKVRFDLFRQPSVATFPDREGGGVADGRG